MITKDYPNGKTRVLKNLRNVFENIAQMKEIYVCRAEPEKDDNRELYVVIILHDGTRYAFVYADSILFRKYVLNRVMRNCKRNNRALPTLSSERAFYWHW